MGGLSAVVGVVGRLERMKEMLVDKWLLSC